MQIKVASVRLAQLYMKRVAAELKNVDSTKEPVREFLLLQGVRFAFRVHQVLLSVQLSLPGSSSVETFGCSCSMGVNYLLVMSFQAYSYESSPPSRSVYRPKICNSSHLHVKPVISKLSSATIFHTSHFALPGREAHVDQPKHSLP